MVCWHRKGNDVMRGEEDGGKKGLSFPTRLEVSKEKK